jgi:hypothetical protein
VGTFISEQLASKLQLQTIDCAPVHFVAADGGPMVCSQRVEELQWTIQRHTFVSSVGILPLKSFDMILRQDWLESHSPMWVHWAHKEMRFTKDDQRISLKVVKQDLTKCTPLSGPRLKGLLNRKAITHCVQLSLLQKRSHRWIMMKFMLSRLC